MKTQGRSEYTYARLYDYLYGYSFYVKFVRLVYRWELSRVLDYLRPQVAVDVGCGTGDSTRLLLKLGVPKVLAVDPNPYMLKIAAIKLSEYMDRVQLIQGSMESLDSLIPKGSADLVTAIFGPFSRVSNARKALSSVHTVLRSGGLLAFDVFNRWSNTFIRRFGRYRVPWITFRKKLHGQRVKSKIYLYDSRDVELLLDEVGFRILKKISLFNYVMPRYSVVTRYPWDIGKSLGDYCLGKLLRKTSGNIIIYIAKKT